MLYAAAWLTRPRLPRSPALRQETQVGCWAHRSLSRPNPCPEACQMPIDPENGKMVVTGEVVACSRLDNQAALAAGEVIRPFTLTGLGCPV